MNTYFVARYSRVFLLTSLLLCINISISSAQHKSGAWADVSGKVFVSVVGLWLGLELFYGFFYRTTLKMDSDLWVQDSLMTRGDIVAAVVSEGFREVPAARGKESLFLDSSGNYLLVKHKHKGKHWIGFVSERKALRRAAPSVGISKKGDKAYSGSVRKSYILKEIKKNLIKIRGS